MKSIIVPPKFSDDLIDSDLQFILDSDKIYSSNFLECELFVNKISAIEFNECKFNKVKAVGIDFYNVSFVDVVFESCDFSNSSFELCSFTRCEFKNCKLLGINVFSSSIQNVLFNGVLSYCNFAANKFKNAIFCDALLEDGRFLENKFSNIYFDKCNINRLEFMKCALQGLDLSSNDFDDIRIKPEDLRGIKMSSYQACIIARKLGIIIEG